MVRTPPTTPSHRRGEEGEVQSVPVIAAGPGEPLAPEAPGRVVDHAEVARTHHLDFAADLIGVPGRRNQPLSGSASSGRARQPTAMIDETRLGGKLEAEGVDVIVATSPQNVFYLSGLRSLSQELLGERAFAVRTTDGGAPDLVLPAVDASIIEDTGVAHDRVATYGSFFLYEGEKLSDADRTVLALKDDRNAEDPVDALLGLLESLVDDGMTVALERSGLSVEESTTVSDALDAASIVEAAPICAELRRVKSDEEIRRLRQSAEVNEAAIEAAVDTVEPGTTERELASSYHRELVDRGADPLFTVVGFGSHGAYPHAVPGGRPLEEGDLIRFDVGCTVENYSSDLARTYAFRTADEMAARRYEVLNGSLDRAIELVDDGRTTTEVFEGTLAYVREAGADVFDAFDRNHVGHGIGIDVYDPPTIDRDPHSLAVGMVLCVEPPYYELGTGGIQVEDEIVITDAGVDRFTACPDTLRVVV